MFDDGASPEEIVEQYNALQLDDVYAVITYYLSHANEVREYFAGIHSNGKQAYHTAQDAFPATLRTKLKMALT